VTPPLGSLLVLPRIFAAADRHLRATLFHAGTNNDGSSMHSHHLLSGSFFNLRAVHSCLLPHLTACTATISTACARLHFFRAHAHAWRTSPALRARRALHTHTEEKMGRRACRFGQAGVAWFWHHRARRYCRRSVPPGIPRITACSLLPQPCTLHCTYRAHILPLRVAAVAGAAAYHATYRLPAALPRAPTLLPAQPAALFLRRRRRAGVG